MARVTVEDCIDKVDSPYELALVAKERTTQLNSGEKPLVSEDNDKNTVIALREIGEGKISIKTIEDSGINKLRKAQSQPTELDDLETEQNDDFEKIYKGEISKSGAAILPSKRVRKMPEKIATSPIIESKKEENIEKIDQQPENEKSSAEEETKQ